MTNLLNYSIFLHVFSTIWDIVKRMCHPEGKASAFRVTNEMTIDKTDYVENVAETCELHATGIRKHIQLLSTIE